MEASALQILLLCIFVVLQGYDIMNTQVFIYGYVVLGGFITGVIFGDPIMGLTIGGTLQLMSLGIGAYGGASIPDYFIGAVIGTAVAILTGKGMDYGLTVAVPVSLLMMQLDVLVRTITVWFVHQAEKCIDTKAFGKMALWLRMGWIPWALKPLIPVLLVLTVGAGLIDTILEMLPTWLMGGISTAGGLLPAVGIGILLRYMNTKKYIPYLIIGFALFAYLNVPMLGIALFGLSAGIIDFKRAEEKVVVSGTAAQMGGMDDEL